MGCLCPTAAANVEGCLSDCFVNSHGLHDALSYSCNSVLVNRCSLHECRLLLLNLRWWGGNIMSTTYAAGELDVIMIHGFVIRRQKVIHE